MPYHIRDDYYKFIFESSLDTILLTTPDGGIHHANPAACTMFQMTEEELRKAGRDGIVDQGNPNLLDLIRERQEKGFVSGELTYIRKDGTRFIGQFTSRLFSDDKGNTWSAMIIRDITDAKRYEKSLKEAHEKLKEMAYVDYLTGVLNRRSLVERLDQEMERSRREFKPLSLILLDIDHFKMINDSYGHLTGDVVLKSFTTCVKRSLRSYDILGRFGGDEFLVCLPDTDFDMAIEIAERIRLNVTSLESCCGNISIKLSASAGVTYFDHTSNEDINTLVSRVDDMMYRAKEKRNAVYTAI
jgi:diguanylate cyclase (GGDEF)-like protein/PAS domain S-box-containing protein